MEINSMFRIILLFFLFLPSLVFGNQLKLECELKNYNGINRSYTPNIIKSWIPEKQTHVIESDSAFFKNKRVEGEVKTNNNKKIKIFYNYQNSTGQWAKYDFIYFKTTKKVAINLTFPGYQPIGDVWGSCIEVNINNKTSNTKTESEEIDGSGNNIDSSIWSNVRSSSSTDLYLNEKNNSIKIKSSNKWYEKLYDRYLDNPQTDIRFGFYFTNDKKLKPKKYDFERSKPISIKTYEDKFTKVFELKTNEAKRLLSNDHKYILFLLMDYEQGMYFWTRTTRINN